MTIRRLMNDVRVVPCVGIIMILAMPARAQEATPAPAPSVSDQQTRPPAAAPVPVPQVPGMVAPPQTTPRPTAPPAVVPPGEAPARRFAQPFNVKVDVVVTEQRGSAAPSKKSVSLVVADGMFGAIRSQSDVYEVANNMPLNIDAEPQIWMGNDSKIRLRLNVQYDLPSPFESSTTGARPPRGTVLKTQLHENLSLVLDSGKSMVAAQSVDPVGDRRVTVEVTATILK